MATALQLTAANSIINGQGLAPSPTLLAQISTYQTQAPIKLLANLYTTATNANANVVANLNTILSTLGSGVTTGHWLLDLYPSNVTPSSSGSVYYYEEIPTPVYTGLVQTGITYTPLVSSASFSNTLKTQANLPFANGMKEFGNVYMTVYGYCASVFDIVSSASVLQNKTYGQSGINFNNQLQLATNGIGTNGNLIANVISNWGTMYDINNISTFSNPYVFGQNLLNQNFGNYGNLSNQLTSAGLNTTNLAAVPQSSSTTTEQPGTTTSNTPFGQVSYNVLNSVTTTTVVAGNSAEVVLNIYDSVTGANLESIVEGTGFQTNTNINSLGDLLDITKVVSPANQVLLKNININSLSDLSNYLQLKVGQGTFTSWADMGNFLGNLEVPTITHLTANSTTPVVSSSIASSLMTQYGTGSGPFGAPMIVDYLGSVAGMPYASVMTTINSDYATVSNSINLTSLLTALDSAVTTYVYSYSPLLYPSAYPSTTALTTAVNNINSALNSLSTNSTNKSAQGLYYKAVNQLSTEVSNLSKAGVVFNSGFNSAQLQTFAMNIGTTATDKHQYQTYQFFANLVTNDSYGETVKLVVAESLNQNILGMKGISTTNDPQTAQAVRNAASQNVSLTTYLSHNK